DQLPSYQSLLYRRKSSSIKSRGSSKGRLSISGRLNTERRKSQMEQRETPERCRVFGRALFTVLFHLSVGMFGTGILSYFSFLRFLVALNLIIFLVMFCFVMLPMIIDPHPIRNVTYNEHQGILINYHEHILDLLSGELRDENCIILFTERHPPAELNAHMNCVGALSLLFSLRSAEGFKRHLIKDEDRFQSFCNKIFAGWDFCITSESAAKQKRNSLLYELKVSSGLCLRVSRIKQKMADRTRKDKCRIYFLRVILNMFVIGVLAVCFFCIYAATTFSQKAENRNKKVTYYRHEFCFKHGYLPSIVITLANFITPLLFSVIINFEDYSPAFEIRFTLMRCVFMRLTSIAVLLFSLWSQLKQCGTDPCSNQKLCNCWETRVGQEMYKLTIFDFIIILSVTLFVEFPRKMLVHFCKCPLAKMWGLQEFSIPQNVLEIVYGQTICWIGTFYCPMLPAICTIKYFCIFYIKKLSLIKNCRPATRPFRASSSHFFFLGVLLIGLILACLPISISLPSQACGPFSNYNTSWEALPAAVEALPQNAKNFINLLGSETFAVSFFLVMVCRLDSLQSEGWPVKNPCTEIFPGFCVTGGPGQTLPDPEAVSGPECPSGQIHTAAPQSQQAEPQLPHQLLQQLQ
uniref:Transmembrane channel-like protein n=1 Tax=Xiphophorus couchianus TaxID=32473 RepID=A0A3B5LYX6_9TELE